MIDAGDIHRKREILPYEEKLSRDFLQKLLYLYQRLLTELLNSTQIEDRKQQLLRAFLDIIDETIKGNIPIHFERVNLRKIQRNEKIKVGEHPGLTIKFLLGEQKNVVVFVNFLGGLRTLDGIDLRDMSQFGYRHSDRTDDIVSDYSFFNLQFNFPNKDKEGVKGQKKGSDFDCWIVFKPIGGGSFQFRSFKLGDERINTPPNLAWFDQEFQQSLFSLRTKLTDLFPYSI